MIERSERYTFSGAGFDSCRGRQKMIFIATIGGLAALIFWGLSDYFGGKSSQNAGPHLTNIVIQFSSVIALLPIVLFSGIDFNFNLSFVVVMAIAALFTIAYVSFLKSLQIGPYGVAAPVANSYALITLIVSLLIFKTQISGLQLIALIIIIIGVIMLAIDKTTFHHKKIKGTTAYLAGIAAIFWGIGFALMDTVLGDFTWYQLFFLISLWMVIFGSIYYLKEHKKIPKKEELTTEKLREAWIAGILITVGSSIFFISLEKTLSVAVPAVIASASPLVTSFTAWVKEQERLSVYKRIGAVIIVIGLMLLNV